MAAGDCIMVLLCLYTLDNCLAENRVPRINVLVNDRLEKIVGSILMGLESMEKNSNNLNVDSLLGIKIVRDQLETAYNKLNLSNCRLSKYLHLLINKSDKILREATPFVKKSEPIYYEKIGVTIQGNWSLDSSERPIEVDLMEPPSSSGYAFNEDDSDKCLGHLVNSPRCRITAECFRNMTTPGMSFYALTHQLLYLQVGVTFECFKRSSIISLESTLCSNIFSEYQQIQSLDFPDDYQDLFMEQAALCGMSGFNDFLTEESLKTVLSWQDEKEGCWKSKRQKGGKYAGVSRYKRYEKLLRNGCRCHKTVVALAALVQFLKHSLTSCY